MQDGDGRRSDPERPDLDGTAGEPVSVRRFYDEIAPFFTASIYGGDEHEVRFFAGALGPPAGRLLELGVGTCRIAVELARSGWSVVGVDQSPSMLALARARLAREGMAGRVGLVLARAAGLAVARPFDAALAVGLFFHLQDHGEYRRVLASAHACLRPGGRFLFDVECRPGGGWGADESLRLMGDVERGDERLRLFQASRALHGQGRQQGLFVIERQGDAGGPVERKVLAQTATFVSFEEIAAMAGEAGFRIEAAWGDYEGRPFGPESPELIIAARRES